LDTHEPHRENTETMLPLEYFMNRLYVAASRPKKRLFIVDTKEAIDNFWNHKDLRETLRLLIDPTEGKVREPNVQNIETFCWVQPGHIDSWSGDQDKPEEL